MLKLSLDSVVEEGDAVKVIFNLKDVASIQEGEQILQRQLVELEEIKRSTFQNNQTTMTKKVRNLPMVALLCVKYMADLIITLSNAKTSMTTIKPIPSTRHRHSPFTNIVLDLTTALYKIQGFTKTFQEITHSRIALTEACLIKIFFFFEF